MLFSYRNVVFLDIYIFFSCRRLLAFWLDEESGALIDTNIFDIPTSGIGDLYGGPTSPYLWIMPGLFFDTQTNCFGKLPAFGATLVGLICIINMQSITSC